MLNAGSGFCLFVCFGLVFLRSFCEVLSASWLWTSICFCSVITGLSFLPSVIYCSGGFFYSCSLGLRFKPLCSFPLYRKFLMDIIWSFWLHRKQRIFCNLASHHSSTSNETPFRPIKLITVLYILLMQSVSLDHM